MFQWSTSDFHVRVPAPWSQGNKVSSFTVTAEALALSAYTVLLPSSVPAHSGCKHRLPTSLTIQQHNTNTHTHTQSTPSLQQEEIIVFMYTFTFILHSVRLKLFENGEYQLAF